MILDMIFDRNQNIVDLAIDLREDKLKKRLKQ